MRKIIIVILSTALIVSFLSLAFFVSVYFGAFGHLQSREELLNYKNAEASIVLSDDGELLGKFFSENRTNVKYSDIPEHLIDALIATEDVRFFRHKGYDVKSFFRVIIKTIMLNNRNAGGGSTITQQLAKNMYGRDKYGIFTILVNKVKEIILASRLESLFSKQEILLLYLNTVSFGENVYGIEAAATRFFNKQVNELTVEESAVLIGLLKANNYYNPRLYPENARKRRNVVLSQMEKYDYLDENAADSLMALPLAMNYKNYESGGPADYFLYQVKHEAQNILQEISLQTGRKWNIEEDGLVITTTLNLELQNYANEAFKEHLSVMQDRLNKQYQAGRWRKSVEAVADRELKRLGIENRASEPSLLVPDSTMRGPVSVKDSLIRAVKVLQAGLIAINPVNGSIKAYVGGIDFKTQPYDQILARRQLASTFKPILYSVAFEQGMSPCDYLDNDSIVDSGIDGWSPGNFDNTYGGKYSLAGALVHSMNVPTYNLYMMTDFNKLDSLWRNLGFGFTIQNYPSLPMGTAEANLREVAIAYSAFANKGFKITPQSIVSIKTADGEVLWENEFEQPVVRVLSEHTALLMNAILRRAVTSGTGASLAGVYGVTLPFAGKTGTSQDYADAWFAAFNPGLVIVSRVGASSPAIHFGGGANGSGSSLALPLVGRTLKRVQANEDLSKKLIAGFPEPSEEITESLGCPDYKEITLFDQIINIFKSDKKAPERQVLKPGQQPQEPKKPAEKKKSFLRRLFEKNR
jgi:penicillin-binding protein 1A